MRNTFLSLYIAVFFLFPIYTKMMLMIAGQMMLGLGNQILKNLRNRNQQNLQRIGFSRALFHLPLKQKFL